MGTRVDGYEQPLATKETAALKKASETLKEQASREVFIVVLYKFVKV